MYEKSKILFKEHFSSINIYLVIFAFVCGFLLGRTNLSNHSNGVESVGAGINSAKKSVEQARTEQQVAEKGIDQAIHRVEALQRSTSETGSIIEQHRASIERCQQLIDQIKQRAKR